MTKADKWFVFFWTIFLIFIGILILRGVYSIFFGDQAPDDEFVFSEDSHTHENNMVFGAVPRDENSEKKHSLFSQFQSSSQNSSQNSGEASKENKKTNENIPFTESTQIAPESNDIFSDMPEKNASEKPMTQVKPQSRQFYKKHYINPRNTKNLNFFGKDLIQKYFAMVNEKNYKEACSFLQRGKCNATTDDGMGLFVQFFTKLRGGYDVQKIWKSGIPSGRTGEEVFCVQYTYQMKTDAPGTPVTELMQYRLVKRPDGAYDIGARVCEKKIKNGREVECPIKTAKYYCR